MSRSESPILLLNPNARAGRTGHRVKDARRARMIARDALGDSRDDTPTTVEILRAAKALSALLYDATEGAAELMVDLGDEVHSPAVVLATLTVRSWRAEPTP